MAWREWVKARGDGAASSWRGAGTLLMELLQGLELERISLFHPQTSASGWENWAAAGVGSPEVFLWGA